MITTSLRNGLRTGGTFSVIIIFVALIGFNVAGAALVARGLGIQIPQGDHPEPAMMAIFLCLVGLWTGAAAAKPDENDSYLEAILSGLFAGVLVGLISGVYAGWMGSLYAGGADLRTYLAELDPASVKLFLFNLDPFKGGVALFTLFSLSGLTGGLMIRLVRSERRKIFTRSIQNRVNGAIQQPTVRKLTGNRWVRYTLLVLGMVTIAILPIQWGSYWNYVLGLVGIYVILGLGLNIIVGLAGQLMLGYVAFFAIGAYAVALLNSPQPHNLMWGFWISLIVGVVLAALTGILLGLPILSLRGDYLAIVTLGFGEIMRILLKSDLMTALTGGPRGIQNIGGPVIFGKSFASDVDFMYLILIAMVITIFVTWRLQKSQIGRQWISIKEDETVSQAMGVDTFRSKLLALAIGAAFAGIGGVLFAARNQFTGPEDHVLMVSINILALVVVGGMGSIPGIILGAFALKGLPEILRDLENYRLMVFGALLVVMMILRPEGLWPSTRPRLEKSDAATVLEEDEGEDKAKHAVEVKA
jgi:ABC-type branched-subunit amino acid transport system permease subunit